MSIAVVGSVGLDTIKAPSGSVKRVLGGSASYFSIAANLFSPVSLVAVIGKDFPKEYLDFFKGQKISLEGVERKNGKTFTWSGDYRRNMAGPQTISVDLGVFADFKPKIPAGYKKNKYIFLANIDPELQMETLTGLRTEKKQITACDTMNFWIENKRKKLLRLLKLIDIFFLNEAEARQLTGESHILKASRQIMKMGPKKIFIKRGEAGVFLFSGQNLFSAPAYPIEKVIDPTGAGDTFAGAVMGYLASSSKMTTDALRIASIYGVIAASFAVEDFSLNSLKRINRQELKNRIKKFRQLTKWPDNFS